MKQKLILMLTFSFLSHIALAGALVYIPVKFFKNTKAEHKGNIVWGIIEDRKAEPGIQNSEFRGKKPEVRSKKAEVRSKRLEVRRQNSEVKSKRLAVRSKKSEAKSGKQEEGSKKLDDVVAGYPLLPDANPENSGQQYVKAVNVQKVVEDAVTQDNGGTSHTLSPPLNIVENMGSIPTTRTEAEAEPEMQAEGKGAYPHFERPASVIQEAIQSQAIARTSDDSICDNSVSCMSTAMTASYTGSGQMKAGSKEGSRDNLNEFLERLRKEIESHKYYPSFARVNGIEGTVYLNLRIGNNGRLEDITIGKSSGSRILDQSALHALKNIEEFSYFPEEMKELDITVPISYKLMEESEN